MNEKQMKKQFESMQPFEVLTRSGREIKVYAHSQIMIFIEVVSTRRGVKRK